MPTLYYHPCIFFCQWLPHVSVEDLFCPHCVLKVLEKNGALPPRRIRDVDDNYLGLLLLEGMLSWLESDTHQITPSLPAACLPSHALAQRQPLASHYQVGNRHKMSASGVRSLLLETTML